MSDSSSHSDLSPLPTVLPRLCQSDNWGRVLDDPAPRSVRWALRSLDGLFDEPDWSKWHYTEGNGFFTACRRAVVPFHVDGSPQEGSLRKITCRRCLSKIAGTPQASMD